MIHELVLPEFVSERLADMVEALRTRAARLKAGEELDEASRLGLSSSDLESAAERLEKLAGSEEFGRKTEDAVWMPREAGLGLLQSALEEFYVKAGAVEEFDQRGFVGEVPATTGRALKTDWLPSSKRPFMRQMEDLDALGWGASFAVARLFQLFEGRAPFRENPPPPVKMGSKVRLVLCADWASGLPRAGKVARQMRARLLDAEGAKRDRHVIHLGDVYYSGHESEHRDNLSRLWPVRPGEEEGIGSFCLNANHDMFSGGFGLYRTLDTDRRFRRQGGCTFFCLENADWQIFGLDTAYESEGVTGSRGGLRDPQVRWLLAERARAPRKKAVLLSHHQLFSGYEEGSPLLEKRLEPVLKHRDPITAWFWGHEHRCAVYQPSHNIEYPALIGHGGVPVYASGKKSSIKTRFEYKESFRVGLEKFARLGFAVLDLDGDAAYVRYVDEEGVEHESHAMV